jgi:hypothetical protein
MIQNDIVCSKRGSYPDGDAVTKSWRNSIGMIPGPDGNVLNEYVVGLKAQSSARECDPG